MILTKRREGPFLSTRWGGVDRAPPSFWGGGVFFPEGNNLSFGGSAKKDFLPEKLVAGGRKPSLKKKPGRPPRRIKPPPFRGCYKPTRRSF